MRVLLVDDNPDSLEALGLLLEHAGHEVHLAGGGERALEIFRAHPPDIAFLDLGLPDIDGFETARRMRAQPGGEGAGIYAVTGSTGDEDRKKALSSGFTGFLGKPVEIEKILAILDR